MPSKNDLVLSARTLVGAEWHHEGRSTSQVDCIGVPIVVAKLLNIPHIDIRGYPKQPDGQLVRMLRDQLVEIPVGTEEPGDLVVMWWDRSTKEPFHVAMISDVGIIHCHMAVGKVVETPMKKTWRKRITNAFSFPGVSSWQH